MENVRFGLMEACRFRFCEEQSQKLWAALEAKAKRILASQSKKKPEKSGGYILHNEYILTKWNDKCIIKLPNG